MEITITPEINNFDFQLANPAKIKTKHQESFNLKASFKWFYFFIFLWASIITLHLFQFQYFQTYKIIFYLICIPYFFWLPLIIIFAATWLDTRHPHYLLFSQFEKISFFKDADNKIINKHIASAIAISIFLSFATHCDTQVCEYNLQWYLATTFYFLFITIGLVSLVFFNINTFYLIYFFYSTIEYCLIFRKVDGLFSKNKMNINQIYLKDLSIHDYYNTKDVILTIKSLRLESIGIHFYNLKTINQTIAHFNTIKFISFSSCHKLTDISPLAQLKQITSADLSFCISLSDINPLTNLKQLISLKLSGCKSLADISPLTSITKLTSLDISNCDSITNLLPIQYLHQIKKIDIEGCLRVTQFPDFKQLKHLYELKSSLHPTAVADILAHCALSRKDWAFINQNADAWLTELQSALKDSHPAAFDLATSLAIAFPHISFELSERLCQILQTDALLDYRPWKHLFLGVFQQMGFNFLQNLASTIAADSWPMGAIGGLAAIAEQLITLADGKEWFAGWVLATSAHHESNPSFLKPVAAPWCLALHCLGENALLDQWIARFTDPDDSSALDAVFLEFGNHRLGHNDATVAFRHAMRIRTTLVRDGLLADIASHYLEAQQADQAAELLFLLSAEDKRAELSLKLADIPHFLDNRDNLHRLVAACGKNAPAIGKLLAKAGMASDFNPADRASICSIAAREATRVGAMIAGTDVRNTENLRQLMEDHFMNIFQAKTDNSSGL